jgi:hypothetical protein
MPAHIISITLWVTFGLGQIVFTGPRDPDYCYKIEKIQPNFELKNPVHVIGTVSYGMNTDAGGYELSALANSKVELREYISQRKQVSVKVVTTDIHGQFDLGTVKPGRYRLLPSPDRGARQPSQLKCEDGSTCELKIILTLSATDQPDSLCPIR